ncbi:hypothetical protein RhiirA5_437513 [Rhizophagus irregularis]|uniref:Uncharacterized protein n=1 Tax=Rhizophagus irregularis TaxID=588596 RepID=A0A2N0NKD2_9GLOM|nr:hypothetical protein RhiirA5_437513 [Rhizophagus irregularis]
MSLTVTELKYVCKRSKILSPVSMNGHDAKGDYKTCSVCLTLYVLYAYVFLIVSIHVWILK